MLKKRTFSGIWVPHTFNHFRHFALLTHNELKKKKIKENRKRLETREVQSNFDSRDMWALYNEQSDT